VRSAKVFGRRVHMLRLSRHSKLNARCFSSTNAIRARAGELQMRQAGDDAEPLQTLSGRAVAFALGADPVLARLAVRNMRELPSRIEPAPDHVDQVSLAGKFRRRRRNRAALPRKRCNCRAVT
jgi:hypothetical protein